MVDQGYERSDLRPSSSTSLIVHIYIDLGVAPTSYCHEDTYEAPMAKSQRLPASRGHLVRSLDELIDIYDIAPRIYEFHHSIHKPERYPTSCDYKNRIGCLYRRRMFLHSQS